MTNQTDPGDLDPKALQRAIEAFKDFARTIALAVQTIAEAAQQIDIDLINLDDLDQVVTAELRAQGAQAFGAYSDDGSGWRTEWTIPEHAPPGPNPPPPAWRLN